MYYREFGKYSKYKNQKTEVNGKKFDSKKEANDYTELLFMENRGFIKDLQTQVPFVLIEKSKYGRVIKYVADFTFVDCGTGELVVADSTICPKKTSTPCGRTKMALFGSWRPSRLTI